jgi:hypothetical protein
MKRELAQAIDFDIQDNEHGGLMLGGHFQYEGGGCQGLGYILDIEFIQRFMGVFNVHRLGDIQGASCWVTHDESGITKIEPLHKEYGIAFNIAGWPSKKKAKRG